MAAVATMKPEAIFARPEITDTLIAIIQEYAEKQQDAAEKLQNAEREKSTALEMMRVALANAEKANATLDEEKTVLVQGSVTTDAFGKLQVDFADAEKQNATLVKENMSKTDRIQKLLVALADAATEKAAWLEEKTDAEKKNAVLIKEKTDVEKEKADLLKEKTEAFDKLQVLNDENAKYQSADLARRSREKAAERTQSRFSANLESCELKWSEFAMEDVNFNANSEYEDELKELGLNKAVRFGKVSMERDDNEAPFVYALVFQNNGSDAWPRTVVLQNVHGEAFDTPCLHVGQVEPKETTMIDLQLLITPRQSKSTWVLVDAITGMKFGPLLAFETSLR